MGLYVICEPYSNAFDERYFECIDQNPTVALRYFSCARAANSMAFALSNNPKGATYEAIIATDDFATIKNLVSQALARKNHHNFEQ
jgi:hypothetical protein